MSEQPLWLQLVRDEIAKLDAAEAERKAEKERLEAKIEQEEREKELRDFATSLRAVLGQDAANEILGGANVELAPALEIRQGNYQFCATRPYKRSGPFASNPAGWIYRIRIERLIPDDWEYTVPERSEHIETMEEFVKEVRELDRRFEARRQYREKQMAAEKREQELAEKAAAMKPVKQPLLSWEDREVAAYLERLTGCIRSQWGLDVGQMLVKATVAYVQHQEKAQETEY